jgi:glycosyltransferase involved in cell wall biosynthesis
MGIMKILVVDITDKFDKKYTDQLCNAVAGVKNVDVRLVVPKRTGLSNKYRIVSLVRFPINKQQRALGSNICRKIYKSTEVLINYIYLSIYLLFHQFDIIHFQWLPFLEICAVEKYILRLFRIIAPKSKFVLTVHNIYPHNCKNKDIYGQRFKKTELYFNSFIVHLKITKQQLSQEFAIGIDKIHVVYHGVTVPDLSNIRQLPDTSKFRIIHFGGLSAYKGTDILIDAIQLLPEAYKEKIEVNIMGYISKSYYDFLLDKSKTLHITWFPYIVTDEHLYSYLRSSDLIVFPYRAISQSGALLSALYFEKKILTSDLPQFKETLEGFKDNWFFISENVHSLTNLLMEHVDNLIDEKIIQEKIKILKSKYLWEHVAMDTMNVYKTIINN